MGLKKDDLAHTTDSIFEIDSYKSKMGDDKDIVVLSFTVLGEQPAIDLVNFIEKGYYYVLDADKTSGEQADGKYRVFVELERNNKISNQITEILGGVGKLANLENFKFNYYRCFRKIWSGYIFYSTTNSVLINYYIASWYLFFAAYFNNCIC